MRALLIQVVVKLMEQKDVIKERLRALLIQVVVKHRSERIGRPPV